MLIDRLAKESGLRVDRLRFFAKTASKRYFIFSIKKATGGYRQIAHPARPLKAVQRWLNSRYLSKLPVHDSAMAYRKGRNIRDNAERHVGQNFTVRIDFKDFFPSFTLLHVYQFMKEHQGNFYFDDEDIRFFCQLVCRDEGLTIGAPTSPLLTNAMMFEFDEKIFDFASKNDLTYTRYADDIFLSTDQPNMLGEAFSFVKGVADDFPYAALRINGKKTAFLSRRYHREVTGLVLTSDGKVSIGRSKKRELKALVHQFDLGSLTNDRLDYLRGYLSFVRDVEPTFIDSLVRKYGEDVMTLLFQTWRPVSTSFDLLTDLDPPDESA